MRTLLLSAFFQILAVSWLIGQSFESAVVNPYLLTNVGARTSPTFGDLLGDGDLDMLSGFSSGDLAVFENEGDNLFPTFSQSLFGAYNISSIADNSTPFFIDMDDDGDLDLVCGNDNSILYSENVGNPTQPPFGAWEANPWLIAGPSGINKPALVDIDDDGDFDLFIGATDGNTYFHENTGTAADASFSASQTNPFGIVTIDERAAPSFADLDSDGDFDLLIGSRNGNLTYFENTGTAQNPDFGDAQTNPFNLADIGQDAKPAFGDLDDDGDADLMVGSAEGDFHFFENTTPSHIHNPPSAGITVGPNPCHGQTTIFLSQPQSEETAVTLFDPQGKRILSTIFQSSANQIELSLQGIPPGVYSLHLTSDGKELFREKLVVISG